MDQSKCETCKKEFSYYRSTLRGKTGRFCSRKCVKVEPNSGQFKNQGKLQEKNCLGCDKTFKTYYGQYCSNDCLHKHYNPASHLGEYTKGQKGEDNYFYGKSLTPWNKGHGNSTEAQKIRNSKDYAIWRAAVFLRDDYTCVECGDRGVRLNADHIKPFSLYPELRLAIDNGRTLCVPCHKQTDTWGHRVFSYEERSVN